MFLDAKKCQNRQEEIKQCVPEAVNHSCSYLFLYFTDTLSVVK